MSNTGQLDATLNKNSDLDQKTMELRLLNCFYNMTRGEPYPFVPMVPPRINPLPTSSPNSLSMQVLQQLVKSVHPDNNEKGEIRIGSFHAPIGLFYNRLMEEMTGYGFGPQNSQTGNLPEAKKLGLGIARVLGADSFKDLENAHVVEGLSNQVKKYFAWVDAWYQQPKHLSAAQDDLRQFGNDHPKHAEAVKNDAVWTRMREIAATVQDATLKAVDADVLGKQAIARISELTNHFHGADFGGDDQGRDWAPRWTATLKAVSTVAEEAYYKNPSIDAGALVTVTRAALADHEKAKELASSEKPVTQIVNQDLLHIFGPRNMAAGQGFQSQARLA